MKFYGNVNLQDNELRAAVLQTESNFPSNPTAGRIIFKDKRVYICAEITGGLPVWIPMTNVVNTYVHNQNNAATTWTVTHNLKTSTPFVQVYDLSGVMIIPDTVTTTNNSTVVIEFGALAQGVAVVMFGDITGSDKPNYAYTYYQTSLSDTWVVTHNLGYYPVVRVFVGSQEVQPSNIAHNSLNQTTISFSQALTGMAVFA